MKPNVANKIVGLVVATTLLLMLAGCVEDEVVNLDTTGPGRIQAAPNDSVIYGEVVAVYKVEGDYPFIIDVKVTKSHSVSGFPNRTSDKVGDTITVKTVEDASKLDVGERITANVRATGDETTAMVFHATNIMLVVN